MSLKNFEPLGDPSSSSDWEIRRNYEAGDYSVIITGNGIESLKFSEIYFSILNQDIIHKLNTMFEEKALESIAENKARYIRVMEDPTHTFAPYFDEYNEKIKELILQCFHSDMGNKEFSHIYENLLERELDSLSYDCTIENKSLDKIR